MVGSLMRALRYPHKFSAMRYLVTQPSLLLAAMGRRTDSYYAQAASRFMGEPLTRALRPMLPDQFREHLRSIPESDGQGWRLLLYLLVRELRPAVFIETGVSRGASSAFILAAMRENGVGKLYSIDLPPTAASVGAANMQGRVGDRLSDGQFFEPQGVGDLVPEYLRDRWELILGDARKELPPLLSRLGKIDVFFHDSLHTYDHMKFEFEASWPHLAAGGLLISHDVVWNPAWAEFTRRVGVKPFVYHSFSLIRKPGDKR